MMTMNNQYSVASLYDGGWRAKDKEQALMELADEMNEMIALGWEEEEAHEDEDAFLGRLGDYAEGLTLEEIWQTWKNVWEIRKEA